MKLPIKDDIGDGGTQVISGGGAVGINDGGSDF